MLHNSTINALSQGDEIGDIVVDMSQLLTLTGKAKNCKGSPFQGYVRSGSRRYLKVKNGEFSFKSIAGYNYDLILVNHLGTTKGLSLSGVTGDKDEDVGTLVHCDPKQGVWIDEFNSVGTNEYIIGAGDLNYKPSGSNQGQEMVIQD